MRRGVIITGPGFQDHDVVYAYYRLKEQGYAIDVATKQGADVRGKYGVPLPLDKTAGPNLGFEQLVESRYDLVILPGGHEAPDRVRQDRMVLDFIREMDRAGKVIAGLCHGPWVMISARIMHGRRACAYVGMRDDMVNCGALVLDQRVVVDDNIVTCSYYAYVGEFMRAVFEADAAVLERARSLDASGSAKLVNA
jgi:protease I